MDLDGVLVLGQFWVIWASTLHISGVLGLLVDFLLYTPLTFLCFLGSLLFSFTCRDECSMGLLYLSFPLSKP